MSDSRKVSAVKIESRKVSTVMPDGRKVSTVMPDGRKVSTVMPDGRKVSTVMTESRKVSAASRKVSTVSNPPGLIDLDDVLVNELGQFGQFQLINLLLVAIPMMMSAFPNEYIFSAAAIPHRCKIPECGETHKLSYFDPIWLSGVIPETSNGFASCQRYAPIGGNGTLSYCPAEFFNPEQTQPCDGFVYAKDNSVVYEFDLGCNDWLRALAGTLNSVGTLLVLPITGYVSDRWGRRVALVISIFNLALIGLLRAFSVNYPMYLVLQILQTTLGAGAYSSSYIFATESVGPKYRVLTSAFCSSMFATGQVILGAVAWLIEPWRYFIIALHVPCFLIVSYYWILSESVRWLLAKQKYDEAKVILRNIAVVNKTKVSEKSLYGLTTPASIVDTEEEEPSLVASIVKSPILLRRVFTTPLWWITTIFVYYGLSINSTSLSDTTYLNYILTCGIEIPGFFSAVLFLNRIGRKATLCGGFFISSACNMAFAFISTDYAMLRLGLYLLGKFCISLTLTSLYLYTSELYPTRYRHSLLAFSSMVGRVGAITAPLTPVLMEYWAGIPSVLFGSMGLVSGILVLTQPETLGTKVPDTLEEAEALGRSDPKAMLAK